MTFSPKSETRRSSLCWEDCQSRRQGCQCEASAHCGASGSASRGKPGRAGSAGRVSGGIAAAAERIASLAYSLQQKEPAAIPHVATLVRATSCQSKERVYFLH